MSKFVPATLAGTVGAGRLVLMMADLRFEGERSNKQQAHLKARSRKLQQASASWLRDVRCCTVSR
eukprot:scaffold117685_cov18-Tisochrysis_lutea.AAC.1